MIGPGKLFKKIGLSSSGHLRLAVDIGSLSTSVAISRVLLLVRDLILAGWLGPTLYGVWTQMVVVFNYSLQLPLGFQNAMSREVPYYQGQGNHQRVKTIQDIVFVVTLSTATLAGLGVLLAYVFFGYRVLDLPLPALLVVSGSIIAQQIFGFFSILLRAHQRFQTFGIGFSVVALLSLVLAVIIAPRWGANGAAFAQGLAYTLVILYWLPRAEFQPSKVRFLLKEFWQLARLAIPLFLVSMTSLLIVSIDRLFIAFNYSKEQIGNYGLAFLISQSISLLITPVIQALSPRLMEAYGRCRTPRLIKHYLVFLVVVMGSGIALFIGGLYLFVGDLLPLLLPRFAPAVEPARILLIGSAFSAVAGGASIFLVSINKQSQVLKIQAGVIVLQAISLSMVVHLQGSINYIAGIMALSYILYATLVLFWAGLSVEASAWQRMGLWLKSCLPVFYVLLSAMLISQWRVQPDASAFLTIGIHLLTWGLLMLPVCIFLIWSLRKALV